MKQNHINDMDLFIQKHKEDKVTSYLSDTVFLTSQFVVEFEF